MTKFSFEKPNTPLKDTSLTANQKKGPVKTFTPPSKSPNNKWVFSGGKKPNQKSPPTKWVTKVTGKSPIEQWVLSGVKKVIGNNDQNEMPDQKREETLGSKRFVHNTNYKGKSPMTKPQWRIFQRQKKADALKDVTNVNKNSNKGKNQEPAVFDMFRKPATKRVFPPLSVVKKGLSVEDEELTSNFIDFEACLNIILVVSILRIEYDVISKVTEAMFERRDHHMQHNIKPLFIQAKINYVGVNKVLVDGGATVNLLPHFLLKNIGLSESGREICKFRWCC